MHSMHTFILLAVLATLALAAPMPKRSFGGARSSFAVPRVRKTGYVRDPSRAMSRAYRKFGWEMSIPVSDDSDSVSWTSSAEDALDTESLVYNVVKAAAATSTSASTASTTSAASSEESGEVVATPAQNGAEYLSQVTVGGQSLTLNFDTGSADLWVFSTYLNTSDIGSHSAYDPSKSSTWSKLAGASFDISYGDGSGAEGIVGYDSVDIGGVTVPNQAIELATSVSSAFVSDADSDGLVGLAFSSLNSVKPQSQNTFFENVMASLEQPLFTVDLDLDGSGTYEFGVIDQAKYTGNLTFVPIDTSSGFWQFESTTYSIGGTVKTNSNPSPAIADTGTSLLLLDPAVVEDYYSQVTGAEQSSSIGGYIYPCSATLPDFAVSIGGAYMANVPGTDITYAKVNSQTCFGGIQSNGGSGLQIFGDVLLQQHFTVFHGESAMIGMANKA